MKEQPSMTQDAVKQEVQNPIDLSEPVQADHEADIRNTVPTATTGAPAKRVPEPENT